MEDQIKALSTRIKELTDTHNVCGGQLLDCGGFSGHLREMHHLANSEISCPVGSIVNISQQAKDLVETFTPVIMQLQDNVKNLSAYIDDLKLEILSLSSSHRSLATISLDGK
ncbi:uncharacterized protein LOC128559490 [Mercenaria mercenaria]|uniref:uncharacterized protein LOC128559490 n=1 Tax=Mercenaria mercenaria TaxID=6596 RepID=UPI00234F917B|nr:uncharacterized protein LOC128559490 [Mercenaria mercenaria]